MKFTDNIQRQEYIDNYILGRLNQNEVEEFEEQLNSDIKLSNDVEFQRIFIKELHGRKKFLNFIAKAENKIQKKKTATLYFRYSIAASFLILLSLSIWQPTLKSDNQIFSEYFDNPQITTHITRSNSSSIFYIPLERFSEDEQKLISESVQDFKNANFDLVVKNLEKIDQLIDRSSSAGLILAVAEINTKDLKNAKKILNKLSQYTDSQITQASIYYHGLVLLKEGETLKARRLFQKLADQSGDYPDKAKEILKKMRYF